MAVIRLVSALGLVVAVSAQYYGDYQRICPPGREVIAQMFEWKWRDVQTECRYLADMGYCGVQVSPPNEHAVFRNPVTGVNYPWYQRYHPVSYQVVSRSGIDSEFAAMVFQCNADGVRVFVDTVINNMAGPGFGYGTASSFWNGGCEQYDGPSFQGDIQALDDDFHGIAECTSQTLNIEDWDDPQQIRNCRVDGKPDLRLAKQSIQNAIATYMNGLIAQGVAGFRLDSALHMDTADLQSILNRLDKLDSTFFPGDITPYVYMDIANLGTGPVTGLNYTGIARATEYRFGKELGDIIRKNSGRSLADLQTFTNSMMNRNDVVAFVGNHLTQRGIGPDNGFGSYVSFFDQRSFTMANAFMLAHNYGQPVVMSSFYWPRDVQDNVDRNSWYGPPSDANGNTNDAECIFMEDFICEHAWFEIANMVSFHNAVIGRPVENWYSNGLVFPNTNNVIAFSRGNNGFFVMNNENSAYSLAFYTGLPDGTYCDVVNCQNNRPPCGICNDNGRQTTITVSSGTSTINIPNDEYPFMAFHV